MDSSGRSFPTLFVDRHYHAGLGIHCGAVHGIEYTFYKQLQSYLAGGLAKYVTLNSAEGVLTSYSCLVGCDHLGCVWRRSCIQRLQR